MYSRAIPHTRNYKNVDLLSSVSFPEEYYAFAVHFQLFGTEKYSHLQDSHLVTWVESERRGTYLVVFKLLSSVRPHFSLQPRSENRRASFFLISCMREAVEGSTHPPSHTYSARHRRRLTHELRV